MALIDLSLVTKTLVGLLETRIRASSDWPTGGAPDGGEVLEASPAPPELVNASRALSFYLYHVREDAHTKSQDWESNASDTPQQFKSMGLTLYYMLCPRSNLGDIADRTYAEQLIMGLALKTLHDFPLINDSSMMVDRSGVQSAVLDSKLRNRRNKLRISMQPTPYNEASQFWQAGSQALRMAAYFEVSATLLEPELPKSRATRVTMLGVHPVTRGQPVIESIRNRISFLVPGEFDPRSVLCEPAQVSAGDTLELLGSDLAGDSSALLISHPDFTDDLAVDGTWQLSRNGNLLRVKVQNLIVTDMGNQSLLPGIYGASVRTTTRRTLADGTQRDFDNFSNQLSFAMVPAINTISALAADLSGTITVSDFVPANLASGSIQLFAGADKLQRVTATPLNPGQFCSDAAPAQSLSFRLPAGIASNSTLPLRLLVRGAESTPHWVITP